MANKTTENVMNQVKSAAGKNSPPSSGGPVFPGTRTASLDNIPEAQSTMNPTSQPDSDDAPPAEFVHHPNVDAINSYPSVPNPGLTTSANMMKPHGPDDMTGPRVNPAPGGERVYTQAEVDAMLNAVHEQHRPISVHAAALHNLSEAVPVSEGRWVTVKPNKTIQPYIGDRTWYLEKDKPVKVPPAVAQELGRSNVIYPVYNF